MSSLVPTNSGLGGGGDDAATVGLPSASKPVVPVDVSQLKEAMDRKAALEGAAGDREYVAPSERYVVPRDATDINVEDEAVTAIGTQGIKITVIEGLESNAPYLKSLCLRSNLIRSMEGISTLTNLTNLEVYDNKIERIQSLGRLVNLTNLDLSYNEIRTLENLDSLVRLKTLYCARNKLKTIDGLSALTSLTRLDLGSNRIREIGTGLATLTLLKELWLGRNKISQVAGLSTLKNLSILDIQSNRLVSLDGRAKQKECAEKVGERIVEEAAAVVDSAGMSMNVELEELYMGHNGITGINGLEGLTKLNTIDLSSNKITVIENVESLLSIDEFWISCNGITSFDQIIPLQKVASECLKTIYLEQNPISTDFEYRKRLAEMFPTLTQIDAAPCRRRE